MSLSTPGIRLSVVSVLLSVIALALSFDAIGRPMATGDALGIEQLVNTQAHSQIETTPSIARGPNGDAVVVWTGKPALTLAGAHLIYFQRFDQNGAASGSPSRATSLSFAGQDSPRVGNDAAGNFVIAWRSSTDIYAKRFSASGAGQGADFRVNVTTADEQSLPDIAVSSAGNFVVVWQSLNQDGAGAGVYARVYDPSGTALGSEFQVNTTTALSQSEPSVAIDAQGKFVIVWTSGSGEPVGNFEGIYMRCYAADGTPLSGEIHVNSVTAGSQTSPDIAMGYNGTIIASWTGPDTGGTGIFARRFDASGLALGGDVSVNLGLIGDQGRPSISMAPTGDFAIAWQGQDASGAGAYFRRFDANGVAQSGDLPLNSLTADDQQKPVIAMDADGDYAAAWQTITGTDNDVYWRAFAGPRPVNVAVTATDTPDPAGLKASLTYALRVENKQLPSMPTGNGVIDAAIGGATGVTLTQVLPEGLTYSSVNGSDNGWSCAYQQNAPRELTCDYAPVLSPGAATTVLVKTTTPNSAPVEALISTSQVSSRQFDDNYSDNIATNSTYACEQPLVGSIDFAATTYSIDESAGAVSMQLRRSNGACSPATVSVTTGNNSALAPQDYQAASTSISWANGDSAAKLVSIPIINDAIYEGSETFIATLANATGAAMGSNTASTVTITETDAAPSFTINDRSVSESAGSVVFTVTKNGATAFSHALNYVSADASAVSSSDYSAISGTLTFAANDATKTITVPILQDTAFEPSETFQAVLSSPTNSATVGDATGVATIMDDDTAPVFSVAPVSASESSSMTFTVSKSGSTSLAHALGYATANGTATAPGDYTGTSGTLSFNASETSKTVTVFLVNDSAYEGNETLQLSLTAPTNGATVGAASVTGTILDDEAAPAFRIDNAQESETGGTLVFTVTRAGISSVSNTVSYATANVTATAGSDYTATSGTLTFPAGVTTQTISVTVTNDTIYEGNETFKVTLSGATNGGTIDDSEAVGTIIENDAAPVISVADAGFAVIEGGANVLEYTITKTGSTALSHSISYRTVNGTAVAPADYKALPVTTITFTPGQKTKTINVTTVQDSVYEGNETVTLQIVNPTKGATLGSDEGLGTIIDDEAPPVFSITAGSASVTEGGDATYTITKSGASELPHTVNVATQTETAGAGDFNLNASSVAFDPSETSKVVTVKTVNDAVYEGTEIFKVKIASATSADFSTAAFATSIVDDDDAPSFSVSGDSVPEGNSGTSSLQFIITKTGSTALTHAVSYATSDCTAQVNVDYATSDCTAQVNVDYAAASGTAIFAPGTDTVTVNVSVNGDAMFEANEIVNLSLSSPTNGASISVESAAGTISNDDAAPKFKLSADNASLTEGDLLTLNIVKTGSTQLAHSIAYHIAPNSAHEGSDYSAVTPTVINGTLTFESGDTSKSIQIQTIDDLRYEGPQTFNVSIDAPSSGAVLQAPNVATVTINDNDTAPTYSVESKSVNEGSYTASFTVTRGGNEAEISQSIGYETLAGIAIGGDSGSGDYQNAAGTLVFAPSDPATKQIQVIINDDNLTEPVAENFRIHLKNPVTGATIGADAYEYIVDNEPAPIVSINDASATEGSSLQFTVSIDAPSTVDHAVSYYVSSGAAEVGSDLPNSSGAAIIAAGATRASAVYIPTTQDSIGEANEVFYIGIVNPTNYATIGRANGAGTIVDDERGSFAISSVAAVNEGDSATVTVARSNGAAGSASVHVNVNGGTASQDADYVTPGDMVLYWAAGDSAPKSFNVAVKTDNIDEVTENISLALSDASGANIGSPNMTSISINDTTPSPVASFIVSGVSLSENNMMASIQVKLSNPSDRVVNVWYSLDGTTAPSSSYQLTQYGYPAGGQISFIPGSTVSGIDISTVNDSIAAESDTYVQVRLTSAENAAVGSPSNFTVTIFDDELPSLSFVDAAITVNESAGNVPAWVGRTGSNRVTSTVRVNVEDGSAKHVSDFGYYTCYMPFEAGQDYVSMCPIPVVDDNVAEGNEYFYEVLTEPGNATLGATTRIKVTIVDNDSGGDPPDCGRGCCFKASSVQATDEAQEGASINSDNVGNTELTADAVGRSSNAASPQAVSGCP